MRPVPDRQLSIWDWNTECVNYDLLNKTVAITGALSVPRKDVISILTQDFHAVYVSAVSKKTDYLIEGEQRNINGDVFISRKQQKAHALHNAGQKNPIIITQEEFWNLFDKQFFN